MNSTLLDSVTKGMPMDTVSDAELVFMEVEPSIDGLISEVPRLMDFIYLMMTVPDKQASEWGVNTALYAWSKLVEITKTDDLRHTVLLDLFDKVKRLYFSLAFNDAEKFSQGINVIMADFFERR